MEPPLDNEPRQNGLTDDGQLRTLRHEIYNQLSNIYLSIEQLRHEIPENSGDCSFYLDLIFVSSVHINSLLRETE